ncbi:hypothetical protein IXB50_01395 [Leptothoe spongobia TAU-MAC 1115]|uniref:Uncharacterized protein n=1 Tax=Leptothoe spongobia TAU-MAC 1115 TaxID=1967444 RepID=A0A947DBE7_9CYAN|nr:hypothetical protein [Leptothoe spongobia TAU-MAC 1115]
MLRPRPFASAVTHPESSDPSTTTVSPKSEPVSTFDFSKVAITDRGSVPVVPFQNMLSMPVQPKLSIGQPGDKYEQEADTVAKTVVQQINSPSTGPQIAQREEDRQPPPLQLMSTVQQDTSSQLDQQRLQPQLEPLTVSHQSMNVPMIQCDWEPDGGHQKWDEGQYRWFRKFDSTEGQYIYAFVTALDGEDFDDILGVDISDSNAAILEAFLDECGYGDARIFRERTYWETQISTLDQVLQLGATANPFPRPPADGDAPVGLEDADSQELSTEVVEEVSDIVEEEPILDDVPELAGLLAPVIGEAGEEFEQPEWSQELFGKVMTQLGKSMGLGGICNAITAAGLSGFLAPPTAGSSGVGRAIIEPLLGLKKLLDQAAQDIREQSAETTTYFVRYLKSGNVDQDWFSNLDRANASLEAVKFVDFCKQYGFERSPNQRTDVIEYVDNYADSGTLNIFDMLDYDALSPASIGSEIASKLSTFYSSENDVKCDGLVSLGMNVKEYVVKGEGHQIGFSAIPQEDQQYECVIRDQNTGVVKTTVNTLADVANQLALHIHNFYVLRPLDIEVPSIGVCTSNVMDLEMILFQGM